MREFLHVDDMASACVYIMTLDKAIYDENTQPMLSHINVGTGEDCTIKEMAETVKKVVGFKGKLKFDATKPDGSPRKHHGCFTHQLNGLESHNITGRRTDIYLRMVYKRKPLVFCPTTLPLFNLTLLFLSAY